MLLYMLLLVNASITIIDFVDTAADAAAKANAAAAVDYCCCCFYCADLVC